MSDYRIVNREAAKPIDIPQIDADDIAFDPDGEPSL